MQEAQTISQVLKRLQDQGYKNDFRAQQDGLRACEADVVFLPEDLVVDKIYRFEGETDLDEEAIIFALSCPKTKLKGTYLVAFGTMMGAIDEEMVRRLKRE